jgi:hypothetical protein
MPPLASGPWWVTFSLDNGGLVLARQLTARLIRTAEAAGGPRAHVAAYHRPRSSAAQRATTRVGWTWPTGALKAIITNIGICHLEPAGVLRILCWGAVSLARADVGPRREWRGG